MTKINDNLKKTIDDLDLDRRLDEAGKLAQKTLGDIKSQVGTLAHDNRDKVDQWVAKATQALDERTDGKYHDKAAKFGVAVGNAVDKVAEQRPAAAGAAPGDPGAGWVPPADGPGTAFTPQFPADAAEPVNPVASGPGAQIPTPAPDAGSDPAPTWNGASDPEGTGWPQSGSGTQG